MSGTRLLAYLRLILMRAANGSASALNFISRLFPAKQSFAVYGVHQRHGIDVYEPANSRHELPIVIFFYGGGWTTGSRQKFRFAGVALARRGFRVYVPDYRLYPQASHQDILDDGAAALHYVRTEHPNAPLFLVGHSAGAHIAVLLGAMGAVPVDGVVALAAPYQGGTIRAQRDLPPALLIAARNDAVVPVRNTDQLARDWSLRGPVTSRLYDRGGHALIVGALSPILRWTLPVMMDIMSFLHPLAFEQIKGSSEPT